MAGADKILRFTGPPEPPLPDLNYATFLMGLMAKHTPDAVAMIDCDTREQRTYGELCKLVPRVAGGLRGAGVEPGDVVMLVTRNHIDYPLALLSTLHCGAIFAPASHLLKPEELSHVLRVSGTKHVVAHVGQEDVVRAAVALLSPATVRNLWLFGGNGSSSAWQQLSEAQPIPAYGLSDGLQPSRSCALMLFSSGTTGVPKGVMLSHQNLIVQHARGSYLQSLQGDQTFDPLLIFRAMLLVVPLSHMYGHGMTVAVLAAGGAVVTMAKFSTKRYLEAIQEYQVTLAPIVPHMASFLAQSDLVDQYDTSSIVAFTSSSAPLSASTAKALTEKTGRGIAGAYGLTETYGAITNNSFFAGQKLDSVGTIVPYCEIKVADVDSGEALGAGVEGEVCARGPNIMLGYVNNPAATRDTLDDHGWLHTGDIGYYDDDGYLYITDRIKDLIKVKGFQVAPTELEAVLLSHPAIADAAVVGVPHPRTGEAPRAFVVPRDGATIDTAEVEAYVAGRVSEYKCLAGGVAVVADIPRNPNGKVLRRHLRQHPPRARL